MIISKEVLKIIVDDWIKPEKSLAKSCRGKFEEVPCYADTCMGTGFGYVVNTYNCTVHETQVKSLWVRRVLGEEKWLIFTQTHDRNFKPVDQLIEIWDDRINIQLDVNNLNGWDYLRIEALYDKLKPYVLYDIPDSDMEERNSQALVLGHCITEWLDKNRPIFKHPLEIASSLKHWHIEYETDEGHVSWSNIPNFRIDIMDDMLTYHHLYGRYILHDMPEKDNKPYWVISDKPIPEYPTKYFNQEERDQMFIYIFRQHVKYILPENEQWFTGYTKNLVESILEAMNESTISDWCHESQMMYQKKALQYKRAEETLTTKRSELVRTHKEPDTDKEENTMFNAEEIDVIKRLIDEIKKLKEHNVVEFKKEIDRSIEQAKKSTDTVCCDTPNATNGFTTDKLSELIKSMRDSSRIRVPTVKEIMINKPATIVFWSDGSKTTSVCDDADKFDPEVGISICIAKKYLGGTENLQLEARRALTRYERREAKKLKKTKKTNDNKSNTSSKTDTNKSNKTSKKKK